MRVVEWNLFWRFGPWKERQPAIIAALKLESPDLLFVQEAWAETNGDRQVDRLSKALKLPHAAYGSRHAHDGVAIGNGIVSRWPLTDVHTLALPTPAELEPRVATIATVEGPKGSLVAASVQLTPDHNYKDEHIFRPEARFLELNHLMEHLAASSQGLPVLLAGDMNAELIAPEITAAFETRAAQKLNLHDAWLVAAADDLGCTVSGDHRYRNAIVPDETRRIDFILAGGIEEITGSSRMSCVSDINGIAPSDHYAVTFDAVGELDLAGEEIVPVIMASSRGDHVFDLA